MMSPSTPAGGDARSGSKCWRRDATLARGGSQESTAAAIATTWAWRFYERMGFRPLDEERIAVLV
jgi:hypothetical protein